MSRSRLSTGLAVAVALGALGTVPLAGTASAEPTYVPQASDIVGVGSDTTQFVMEYLANGTTINGTFVDGYNAGKSSDRLVSFDALGTGLSAQITPKAGAAAITRPNGSTAGKNTLWNPSVPEVNFARSSSSLSSGEVSAGLWQVPFAVDGLKMATAQTTNAPASIPLSDVVKIYNGQITTWNQITGNGAGSSDTIDALVPQSGSGTRSFFLGLLKAANSNTDVSLAGVAETQEHSDVDIKSNPNALAPFSTGRAETTPTVKLVTGAGSFDAQRALYNVVRQGDLNASWFGGLFGAAGYVCSDAARPLIEAAGFHQLARAAGGGVCGQPAQAATTNFTTNVRPSNASTTNTLAASATAQTVRLTATIGAAQGTPVGSVQFFEGATPVGPKTNLSGGVALVSLPNIAPGVHTYTARYTSFDPLAYPNSTSAPASVTVAAPAPTAVGSTTKLKMPSTIKPSERATLKVTVKTDTGSLAKGKVAIKKGAKTLDKVKLKQGKAKYTLPKLKVGKYKITVKYLGRGIVEASKVTKTLKVVR
jgi:ABC-type phosphate transport system substrate-binding protein